MIEYMLNHKYNAVELFHVRMNFSKEMNERGKLSFYKISHLIDIIVRALLLKFKHNIEILYYPLSNSPKVSVLRDMIILGITRLFFKKTIFHFHAAGISEELPKLNFLIQKAGKIILNSPDLSIATSSLNPADGKFLKSKKDISIPYGIPDIYPSDLTKGMKQLGDPFEILFVGLLNSTKGEGYIVDAISILEKKGYNIHLKLAGKFETLEYEEAFYSKLKSLDLVKNVQYLGVITGKAKQDAFFNADLFCFPSFFVSESFGVVLLEAMIFKLPIIATRWRGIQSVVEDGKNGFLVDIKEANQIADKIEFFLNNPEQLEIMGEYSRELYSKKYNLDSYINNLEQAFINI